MWRGSLFCDEAFTVERYIRHCIVLYGRLWDKDVYFMSGGLFNFLFDFIVLFKLYRCAALICIMASLDICQMPCSCAHNRS